MSKIYEALRMAESSRSASATMSGLEESPALNKRESRRSRRRAANSVIRVYGHGDGEKPFYEEARLINESEHGALLVLGIPVSKGQQLLLFNEETQTSEVCEIVHTRSNDTQSLEVAVVFPNPRTELQ